MVLTINLNITLFEKLKEFRFSKFTGIFIFPEMRCILGQLLVFQSNYALDEGLTLEISTSKSLFSGHLISKVLPWSLDWLLEYAPSMRMKNGAYRDQGTHTLFGRFTVKSLESHLARSHVARNQSHVARNS